MPRALFPWLLFVGCMVLWAGCGENLQKNSTAEGAKDIEPAARLLGLEMTPAERAMMAESLVQHRAGYGALRGYGLDNSERPALLFDPELGRAARDNFYRPGDPLWSPPPKLGRPDRLEDLAFATVHQLSHLIRTRQVSSEELTRLSLDRLKKHGHELECVITLLEERALWRARELDGLLERGIYLGPLHGIPYGVKDLLALEGTRTTWGATPYRDQVREGTAGVIRKLDAAGAVLVAMLTLGALAMDDVWYGGQTRNPWNLEEGSSGSSAGSAAAVAAGLVPFAIGTETLGSIVSPCTRCGTTGLRPTFGRVGKSGAMALSWSMDKIGPIARGVEDCAVVLDAIRGRDPGDPSALNRPFPYRAVTDLGGLRIGFLEKDFARDYPGVELERAALTELKEAGAHLVPVAFPLEEIGVENPWDLLIILEAEAGAAFQELVLDGRDDLLVRQRARDWPNIFRAAQFIPAVEYIQANRARGRLQAMMATLFQDIDVLVVPSLQSVSLMITNLTGQPQVVVPAGFLEPGRPHSISFVADIFDEAAALAVARVYQERTAWHREHPAAFMP